jgi:NAD(P)-dependent dehydrogenase (short-subunit alcohol dehydrogenase family)
MTQRALEDRTIVVTGAGRGIGRATALHVARSGGKVAMAGRDEGSLQETGKIIRAEVPDADLILRATDITNPEQVDALFDHVSSRMGPITGLVANAAIIGDPAPALTTSLPDWQAILNTNVIGTWLTLSGVAKRLAAEGRAGSLVVIGSSTAIRTIPEFLPYVASKGAVHTLARALALELAPSHIRVNVIAPSTIATEGVMAIPGHAERIRSVMPMKELIDVNEVAETCVFLLGDSAPHMTGAVLTIDSGRTIG